MAVATVADFVEALRSLALLTPEQLAQSPALQQQFPDVVSLGQELLRRGWLTLFQANQIGKGKGHELVLDQYVLLDLLGQGGMGSVFKARQRRMDRLVALKVIRREALRATGAVERFLREARVAAQLSHPNVVTVFDSQHANGVHFLVMEYLEGTDLARLLKTQGPLPVGQACDCIRQAALGLQHAHEKGLVHRDVKPHNLMLTTQGVVKVMDLGLARAVTVDGAASDGLTAPGAVLGTADYIAPEQALNARRADIRADIFSLGCTLYHLLTNRVPFEGDSLTEKLLARHLAEAKPIEQLRSGLPAGLPAVVRRLMARNPEKRYPTPGEAAASLGPFALPGNDATSLVPRTAASPAASPLDLEDSDPTDERSTQPLPNPVVKRPPRRWPLLLLGLAATVLLALGAVLRFGPGRSPENSPQASLPPRPTTSTAPNTAPTRPDTRSGVPANFVRLKDRTYKDNALGMVFVQIPPGRFTMGSPPQGKAAIDADEALHDVEITAPFYLGVFEVTQEQYQKVMGNNPSHFRSVEGMDTRHFPVESVTWKNARDFCAELSRQEAERKIGWSYRLPTEAEWEYACRGKTTTPFHFGGTLTSDLANFDGRFPYPEGSRQDRNLQRPTTVGSYQPNAFGLYDMHGNVGEWCADWHGPYDLKRDKNPSGAEKGVLRVVRGGAWYGNARGCRSAVRGRLDPAKSDFSLGFRVVLLLK